MDLDTRFDVVIVVKIRIYCISGSTVGMSRTRAALDRDLALFE